jgi:hypothetical protein
MFEDLLNKKHKKGGCEVEMCPQCASSDVDVYPTSVCDLSFCYICCNACGFRWTTSDV